MTAKATAPSAERGAATNEMENETRHVTFDWSIFLIRTSKFGLALSQRAPTDNSEGTSRLDFIRELVIHLAVLFPLLK